MRAPAPADVVLPTECRTFSRYLADLEPPEYVKTCYARAWTSAAEPGSASRHAIDLALLKVARLGGVATRIADAYARIFRPRSPLRRRLILLLAILENTPPSAGRLTTPREGNALPIGAAMAGMLLASLACLLVGVILLGPVHLLSLPAVRRTQSVTR